MFRRVYNAVRRGLARLRERIAVDDPEERIEGSGEAIVSPQHRRSAEAERVLNTDTSDDSDGDEDGDHAR